jgi:hypothetical protein
MLRIDVEGLSEAEVKAALIAHCSRFGSVRKVTVCRPVEGKRLPLALVEMADEVEARGVIGELGGTTSGVAAIIRLAPPLPPRKCLPRSKRKG